MAMAIFAVVTATVAVAAVGLADYNWNGVRIMTVMAAAELCKVVLVPECNIPIAKFVSCIETDPTASPLRFQMSSMAIPIGANASSYVIQYINWNTGAGNRAAGARAAWEKVRAAAFKKAAA